VYNGFVLSWVVRCFEGRLIKRQIAVWKYNMFLLEVKEAIHGSATWFYTH